MSAMNEDVGGQQTTILALRHGETDWNVEELYQGHIDIGLNAEGRAQAERAAQALASEPIDAIFSSDLARASDTAEILARPHGLAVRRLPALREQHYGCFQGLDASRILQRWPDDARRWLHREPGFAPPGGESRQAFNDRCVSAIAKLAREHVGLTIAVVCHGGVLDCLFRSATGLPLDAPRRWPLENAAVSRLLHGPQGFTLLEWGGVEHLAGSRDSLLDRFPAP